MTVSPALEIESMAELMEMMGCISNCCFSLFLTFTPNAQLSPDRVKLGLCAEGISGGKCYDWVVLDILELIGSSLTVISFCVEESLGLK
jgi:hypothetical protein